CTPHTSCSERNRTETGSNPTTTLPRGTDEPLLTSESSIRASGKLQMAKARPSGPIAMGLTGAVSQLTKAGSEVSPLAARTEEFPKYRCEWSRTEINKNSASAVTLGRMAEASSQ